MTHREYEYMKPSRMPDWMKDFAEKEAFGKKEGNYIDHINEILHPESKTSTVEARIEELREKVGLDMLKQAEDEKVVVPSGTKKSLLIDQLVIMANELDDSGMYKEARVVDKRIMSLAKESEDKKSEEESGNIADIVDDPKFRKILEFIDKVVEGRGGKVTLVSIQAMIENEKGFDMSNPEVQKYLENKIKAVRESSPDVEEGSGLFGIDIQEEDRAANNQMFHMPETDMG